MRKRLRKKLHLGEYNQLGFTIKFKLDEKLSEPELDTFWVSFIDAIEENQLGFYGGGYFEWEGFVTHHKERKSANEEQRKAIEDWLKNNPLVVRYEVGSLKDCWYD